MHRGDFRGTDQVLLLHLDANRYICLLYEIPIKLYVYDVATFRVFVLEIVFENLDSVILT